MQNFDEHKDENKKLDFSIWKKVFKVMVRRKKLVFLLVVTLLVMAVLDIVYPLMNSYAIKTFFSDNPDYTYRTHFIVGYVGLAILFGLVVFSFIKTAGTLEVNIAYDIRKEAFENFKFYHLIILIRHQQVG